MTDLESRVEQLLVLLKSKSLRLLDRSPWHGWMEEFLEALDRNGGIATRAIETSSIARSTIYLHRERNERFRRRWAEIVRRHKGLKVHGEGAAAGRAVHGSASRPCEARGGGVEPPREPLRPGLPPSDAEARLAVLQAFRHDDVEAVVACLRSLFSRSSRPGDESCSKTTRIS